MTDEALRLLASSVLEQRMIDSLLAFRLHRRNREHAMACTALHALVKVSTIMYERTEHDGRRTR